MNEFGRWNTKAIEDFIDQSYDAELDDEDDDAYYRLQERIEAAESELQNRDVERRFRLGDMHAF